MSNFGAKKLTSEELKALATCSPDGYICAMGLMILPFSEDDGQCKVYRYKDSDELYQPLHYGSGGATGFTSFLDRVEASPDWEDLAFHVKLFCSRGASIFFPETKFFRTFLKEEIIKHLPPTCTYLAAKIETY
jgi:hypothetical protein